MHDAGTGAGTGPEDILTTYDRAAEAFARDRDRSLFEAGWLARMRALAPGPRLLDLGCGTGLPVAAHLAAAGMRVTGVYGAAAMVAAFRANLPGARAIHADMRALDLGERFDAILAWDSFFHLAPAAQRAMFPRFAAHAAPGAALMFTSGPAAGERIGAVGGWPLYHASLDPAEYEALLTANRFSRVVFAPEDAEARGRSVWLAQNG